MQKDGRKTALIGVILIMIIALGIYIFSEWKKIQQLDQEYQDSIATIDAADYELAVDLLEALGEEAVYPDADMLLMYARLMYDRETDVSIEDQYLIARYYEEEYDGLYAGELAELVQTVKEEYSEELEQQEKEYREQLAAKIPYVGMSSSYINDTIMGEYDDKLESTNSYTKKKKTKYYWYVRDGKYCVLTVVCESGEVTSVDKGYEDVFWNEDGTPNFDTTERVTGSGSSSGSSYTYDDGYDDVYFDEEYDTDRYDSDLDYMDGVDDAMDDIGEYW